MNTEVLRRLGRALAIALVMALLVWAPSRVVELLGLHGTTGGSPLWVRILVALGNWGARLWPAIVLVALLDQALDSALARRKRSDRLGALMLLVWLVLFAVLSWLGESDSPGGRAGIGAFLALLLVALLLIAKGVASLSRFGWRGAGVAAAGLLIVGAGLGYYRHRMFSDWNGAPWLLTLGELQVRELITRDQRLLARATGPETIRCELAGGETLADGVVLSVDPKGVVVEAVVPGRSTKKRLVRFALAQRLPPIALGRDTTRITSPLLADGTPDYGAWLNAKYGAGVTPENNAAVPLSAALGGMLEAGRTFWDGIPPQQWADKVQSRPWSEDECPACARRLALNEKPLASMVQAVRRPRYFAEGPSGGRITHLAIPSLLRFRVAANALAGRGMLRIGRGDWKGAREDALAVQRLSVLLSQGPSLIERLIAIALRGVGMALLPQLAARSADAAELRELLADLHALPELAGVAQSIDDSQRLQDLDAVLLIRERVAQGRNGSLPAILEMEWLGQSDWPAPEAYLLPAGSIDWEETLRAENRRYDLALAIHQARLPDELKRARAAADAESSRLQGEAAAALARLREAVRSEETRAADIARAAEKLDDAGRRQLAGVWLAPRWLARSGVAAAEVETQFRMAVLAVALAAHKLEKGGYPPSLADDRPSLGYTLSYLPRKAGHALTAAPLEWGETGTRGFCVDSTGAMRSASDPAALKLVDGACGPSLPLLK